MYFVIHILELDKHRLSTIQTSVLHAWISIQGSLNKIQTVTMRNRITACVSLLFTCKLRIMQHLSTVIHLHADILYMGSKEQDDNPSDTR